MRKLFPLILCLCLLLTGCSDEEAEPTTQPAKRPQVSATVPTETIPETTVPEETALNTVVLRNQDVALRKSYVLIALSPEAPFLAQGVELNETGADALAQWISTEDTRNTVKNLGMEEFGEAIFTMPTDGLVYGGKIKEATTATETIRLAVESQIVDSGLTDVLLPAFEEAWGYTVTLTEGSPAAVLGAARGGYADLILMESGPRTEALVTDGFARRVSGLPGPQIPVCAMQYLLCGPQDDPANIANCASVGESFAAIARGEFPFTSRGDDSSTHQLEQQFWPANQDFGDWYISADMEMGPCLVMNDLEGGYILTDKLTWLIYSTANGII